MKLSLRHPTKSDDSNVFAVFFSKEEEERLPPNKMCNEEMIMFPNTDFSDVKRNDGRNDPQDIFCYLHWIGWFRYELWKLFGLLRVFVGLRWLPTNLENSHRHRYKENNKERMPCQLAATHPLQSCTSIIVLSCYDKHNIFLWTRQNNGKSKAQLFLIVQNGGNRIKSANGGWERIANDASMTWLTTTSRID